MRIGVPAETRAGETRVAMTPETAKKLKAQGHTLLVQSGAGLAASVTDAAYEAVGVEISDAAGALSCELVLKVSAPSAEELKHMKSGAALVGMLNPFDAEGWLNWLAQASPVLRSKPRPVPPVLKAWMCCLLKPTLPATKPSWWRPTNTNVFSPCS